MKSKLILSSMIYLLSLHLRGMETDHSKEMPNHKDHIGQYSYEILAENVHKCACEKRFNTLEELKEHVQAEYAVEYLLDEVRQLFYKCCKCENIYTKMTLILLHYPEHTGEIFYTCTKCKVNFSNLALAKEHQLAEEHIIRMQKSWQKKMQNRKVSASTTTTICRNLMDEESENEFDNRAYSRKRNLSSFLDAESSGMITPASSSASRSAHYPITAASSITQGYSWDSSKSTPTSHITQSGRGSSLSPAQQMSLVNQYARLQDLPEQQQIIHSSASVINPQMQAGQAKIQAYPLQNEQALDSRVTSQADRFSYSARCVGQNPAGYNPVAKYQRLATTSELSPTIASYNSAGQVAAPGNAEIVGQQRIAIPPAPQPRRAPRNTIAQKATYLDLINEDTPRAALSYDADLGRYQGERFAQPIHRQITAPSLQPRATEQFAARLNTQPIMQGQVTASSSSPMMASEVIHMQNPTAKLAMKEVVQTTSQRPAVPSLSQSEIIQPFVPQYTAAENATIEAIKKLYGLSKGDAEIIKTLSALKHRIEQINTLIKSIDLSTIYNAANPIAELGSSVKKCCCGEEFSSCNTRMIDHFKDKHILMIQRENKARRFFQCDKDGCDKTYYDQLSDFLAHLAIYHNGVEFNCRSCNLTKISPENLRIHLKEQHNKDLSI